MTQMNGLHDCGGMQCYGRVDLQVDPQVFHEDWEKQVFSLTLGMASLGFWNLDQMRFSRESLPPDQYLLSSYYEIWFYALLQKLIEHGIISKDWELLDPGASKNRKETVSAEKLLALIRQGNPVNRPQTSVPQFNIGDKVLTLCKSTPGHTRLPRYAQGKMGTVVQIGGFHLLPDKYVNESIAEAEWLYSVEFKSTELWGDTAHANDCIRIDAWESYLHRMTRVG